MVPQLPRTSSYGEITKSRQVAGFVLTETIYRPGVRTPRHSHELGFLYTVLDGSFTESLGRIVRKGQPLTLALRPAGQAHSHGCGTRGARLLNLYPICLDRSEGCSNILREPDDIRGAAVPWLVSRLYREFQCTDGASSLAIEGLALEILAEASRSSSVPGERRPPRWLEQTLRKPPVSIPLIWRERSGFNTGVPSASTCDNCALNTPVERSLDPTHRWLPSLWTRASPIRAILRKHLSASRA